ncbi:hypothetical protein C8Q79DRAFT_431950 [Trametes meyenii]|nr:hypothetical protein C8Q79DRAFT_431950 [Trametes meyenii]
MLVPPTTSTTSHRAASPAPAGIPPLSPRSRYIILADLSMSAPAPSQANEEFGDVVAHHRDTRPSSLRGIKFPDTVELNSYEQTLFFSQGVLDRSLSVVRLAIGVGVSAPRMGVSLKEDEAKTLWEMLRRMKHLEGLTLEDPDGILDKLIPKALQQSSQDPLSPPIATSPGDFDSPPMTELAVEPLLLPRLQHVEYDVTYTVELCHAFLSSLRESHLLRFLLRFGLDYEIIDPEKGNPDPFILLAKPCAIDSLQTLVVENLTYGHFDVKSGVHPQFVQLRSLSLDFALDAPSSRKPILQFLLAACPNLSHLEISSYKSPHDPPQDIQYPSYEEIHSTNLNVQETAATRWRLRSLKGSLVDLWLLGLRCPVRTFRITKVDFDALPSENLVQDLFNGTSPLTLSITLKVMRTYRLQANAAFLELLSRHWSVAPLGGAPNKLRVRLNVTSMAGLRQLLDGALALVSGAICPQIYRLDIHLHYEPGLGFSASQDDMDVEVSDEEFNASDGGSDTDAVRSLRWPRSGPSSTPCPSFVHHRVRQRWNGACGSRSFAEPTASPGSR